MKLDMPSRIQLLIRECATCICTGMPTANAWNSFFYFLFFFNIFLLIHYMYLSLDTLCINIIFSQCSYCEFSVFNAFKCTMLRSEIIT